MGNPNDRELEKFSSPDLRAFADGDSDQRLSVLIELKAEPPELVIGDRGWGQPSRRILAIGKQDDPATAVRMARLQNELAAILGAEPVRLDVAEAFVADVAPAQLREITRLEEVGHIRPNRRHRAE